MCRGVFWHQNHYINIGVGRHFAATISANRDHCQIHHHHSNVSEFQHKVFATEYRLSKHTYQHKSHHHYCHKMHAAIWLLLHQMSPKAGLKAGCDLVNYFFVICPKFSSIILRSSGACWPANNPCKGCSQRCTPPFLLDLILVPVGL